MNSNRSKEKSAEVVEEQSEKILSKFDTESDYKEEALSSTLFVYKLGLSNVHPALLMNGQVYGSSQVCFLSILLTLSLLGRLAPVISSSA